MRRALIISSLLCSLLVSSCGKKHKARIPVPLPPQPAPAAPAPAPSEPASENASHPVHHRAPAAPAPAPSAAPARPASAAPIQLGDMLSPDEQQKLSAAIDASVARANRNLAALSGRTLSSGQRETVNQIRSFLKQAENARSTDLQAARSLAERADLLSRDLLQNLR